MKRLYPLLLLLLWALLSPLCAKQDEKSLTHLLSKRDNSAKVGALFHYTGFLRYSNLLLGEYLYEGLGYAGYFSASGRKIHGDIMAGVAASRACRTYNQNFNKAEHFSWKYYIAGVSSYSIGFASLTVLMRADVPREVGISLYISGITACEILSTIHIIKARRTTKKLLSQVQESNKSIAWSVLPYFTSEGGGVALMVGF